MQKHWLKFVIAAIVVVVIAVVLIPFFVNADAYRPKLQEQLSTAMGRRISLGHLSLSLLSGSLVAEEISIADDPAFSESPFIEAKSLSIGVELQPLLFDREVRITKLAIELPTIHLISKQNGVWNFSSLGKSASTATPQSESAFPDLTVGELKIESGTATVSSLLATEAPITCTAINLDIQQFSFLKAFPFQLSAQLPGAASVDLKGTAGPVAQKNAADTPFNATLQLKHFDPLAAGVVQPSAGIFMVLDLDAKLASDATALTSTGTIQAARLQLSRFGSPAPNPVNIDYTISHDLDARSGKVYDIAIHSGSVAAHVNGNYRLTPQAIVLDLRLAAPNLPIDQLEQLLPAFGVKVPSGSSLKGGTLTASFAITGPATALTLSGPAEIDNTLLTGFDLGSRIEGINPFGTKGGGTGIQTLRADIDSSPQSTRLTNIYGNIPQIGTASGEGSVSPSGALDFKLAAKFNPNTGVGAIAAQAQNLVGNLLGGFAPLKSKVTAIANNGIPLTITGTSSSPTIRADLKAMLR
jgi:AsmA protein